MNVSSPLNTGLAALQRAQANARQNAAEIARAEPATPAQTSAMAGLLSDRQQALAAVEIIKTADDVLGTILDLRV